MKTKCLLLLVTFFNMLIIRAGAQITLDSADLPAPGLVLENAQDTLIVVLGIGVASDEAQVWDFTTLDADVLLTNTVVPPEATPNGDQFPTATFAFESNDSLYSYVELRDSMLLALGGAVPFTEDMSISLAFDPPQQLLTVPATYGSTFSSPFRFELTVDGSEIGADSIRVTSNAISSGEIDAFGEITVPAGTFPALRQRTEIVSVDSIFVKAFGSFFFVDAQQDTSISFEWWGQNGLGTICSVEMDTDGTPLSATYLTNVQPPSLAPVASFTFEEQEAGAFQFTDASTNEPTSWTWDFGDGNTSTQQNPSHIYAAPGVYTVCLTAANSGGEDEACQPLTVVFVPQADFSFEVLSDSSFQFTDLSANEPTSWNWDFGDGNTSTEQNPMHTYAASGDYTVCLTAANSAGSNESCENLEVVIVSTAELNQLPLGLTVFPSPAQDQVNVRFKGLKTEQAIEVRVYNQLGQQMLQQYLIQRPEGYRFSVATWQPGIYHLTAVVGSKRLIQSFTVE